MPVMKRTRNNNAQLNRSPRDVDNKKRKIDTVENVEPTQKLCKENVPSEYCGDSAEKKDHSIRHSQVEPPRAPDANDVEKKLTSHNQSSSDNIDATASKGSIVALIPILCTFESITESISAKLSERCVPLFVGTNECISSIIIHFISLRIGLNLLLASARPKDSGVVIKI